MSKKGAIIISLLTLGLGAQAFPTVTDNCLDSIIGLGEVSVSAIKSTSTAQFPVSATTINSTQIEEYDIYDIKEVSEIAPNFYMPKYGSRMTSTIFVRGLGTRIDQPVVALNVDNVQILNKDNFDFHFPDMTSIEVVRGAQSILYGRNSIGGVVNINTLSPLDFQGVRASVEGGSGNTWRASLSGYFKASESLGVGIITAMNSTDGFFRNLYTGEKIDKERQGFTKVKVDWRPTSRFRLENSAWVSLLRQGGYPYEYAGRVNQSSSEPDFGVGTISHNDTCFYRRTTVIDGLTMKYGLDDVTLSSITGFQYHKDNMTLDQDFLPLDYFTLSQRRHEWSLTQDFVAKGNVGSYTWLSGLYGLYRRYDMSAPVDFKDYGISHLIEGNINAMLPAGMKLQWDERNLLLDSDFKSNIWGWAVYHKSEFSVANWVFSAGLRLAFERTNFEYLCRTDASATMYRQAGPTMIPLATIGKEVELSDRLHTHSLQLLPEVKVSYRLSEGLSLGAVASKGYKSGGYNTQIFSDVLQQTLMREMRPMPGQGESTSRPIEDVIMYRPETSWNYELDMAYTNAASSLSVDASLYFIDCRDQQMTVFPEGEGTGRMMANAGRTRSIGGELSVRYMPVEDLRLACSYGLTDARFRHFDNGIKEYRGKHVPYAPENTFFASASYRFGLRNKVFRSIEPMVSCRGVGRIYWNEENDLSQPFYATLNGSVTFGLPDVKVELWGENLTGTRFSTFYFESVGNRFLQRGMPRRFGVTVRVNVNIAE